MRLNVATGLLAVLLYTTSTEATGLSPAFPSAPLPTRPTSALFFQNTGVSSKSPKTAFFLSLMVPGLGELYSGARWRAAGFFATETLTWLAYFNWRSKGSDLRTEFRQYADQHWDESRYRSWQSYNQSQPEGSRYFETETLPSKSEDIQQYYELVGKYAQFVFGWDDVTVGFTTDNMSVQSVRRVDYETQRNESNKRLKRASTIIGVVMLNHIVSAIHASAYARSLQLSKPVPIWVDFQPIDARGRPNPTVELKARF
ncbi:MAG: DUF5683 domain-containing protein [bacterium]|nr:DUF5683 domain-containing protein [bacterium]